MTSPSRGEDRRFKSGPAHQSSFHFSLGGIATVVWVRWTPFRDWNLPKISLSLFMLANSTYAGLSWTCTLGYCIRAEKLSANFNYNNHYIVLVKHTCISHKKRVSKIKKTGERERFSGFVYFSFFFDFLPFFFAIISHALLFFHIFHLSIVQKVVK